MKSQASSDFYRSLFDNMLDGLAYCQMVFNGQGQPVDWIYLEVNKNFEKLTGLKDVVGKKATEAIPEIALSNPELFEIYGRVSLTGKPENFETYIEPLLRWFFVSVYSPKKKFFIAILHNITDQKQIEKELKNARIAAQNVLEDLSVEKAEVETARAKEEAILHSVGDGLISADEKGNITLINKSAEKLLGLKNEEIIGKALYESIRMVDEKDVPVPPKKRPVYMALSTGTTTTTTTSSIYYYVRKDKTKFPVAITVTPVKLEGKIVGVIEVFRDITRETQVDKAKSEFVSLASHQLRTPLSAIKWYSKMLLDEDVGKITEKQKEYLEEIHNGNERMVSLVNALLNVSRIELGTFAVAPKKVNLVTICQDVLEGVKEEIAHKGLNVKEEFKKVSDIEADPSYIRIIFQNLITNAIKYTPDGGGTITITISQDKTNLLLSVKDTGYGIPEKAKEKIFTKLFRADNVVDKDTDGTGLGLYITKSVVEQAAKGKIWFESKENKGTTFFVSLPLTGMIKREGVKGLI